MKLKLLIFFITATTFVQAQTTPPPVSPVPVTQNSLYYEPSTKRMFGFRGNTYGWWQMVDSIQLKKNLIDYAKLTDSTTFLRLGNNPGGTRQTLTQKPFFSGGIQINNSLEFTVSGGGGSGISYSPTTFDINPGYDNDFIINNYNTTNFKMYGTTGNFLFGNPLNVTDATNNKLVIASSTGLTPNKIIFNPIARTIKDDNNRAVLWQGDVPTLAHIDSAFAAINSSTNLKAWTNSFAYTVLSATRNSDEAITTASVVWPDGSTGTLTTDTLSTDFPGAIDAYHVTYVPAVGTTKTITQSLLTRDASGAVIVQPTLTVTP